MKDIIVFIRMGSDKPVAEEVVGAAEYVIGFTKCKQKNQALGKQQMNGDGVKILTVEEIMMPERAYCGGVE